MAAHSDCCFKIKRALCIQPTLQYSIFVLVESESGTQCCFSSRIKGNSTTLFLCLRCRDFRSLFRGDKRARIDTFNTLMCRTALIRGQLLFSVILPKVTKLQPFQIMLKHALPLRRCVQRSQPCLQCTHSLSSLLTLESRINLFNYSSLALFSSLAIQQTTNNDIVSCNLQQR